MTTNNTFEKLKDVATFVIAIVTCIAGVIFWVQSANDDNIKRLEGEIAQIRVDVKDLEKNNSEDGGIRMSYGVFSTQYEGKYVYYLAYSSKIQKGEK